MVVRLADVMEAASAVEAPSSHWPEELISDLPWAPRQSPCLIRQLRITATYIFCFCHMDALGEVLCALSI
jgi:hypothetical protein